MRAAVTRASSARSSMLGTISAARTPMITSTTISSIRVKPRLRRRRFIVDRIVEFYRSSASVAGVVDHNRRMFARLSAFVIWSLVAAAAGVLGAALRRLAAAGAGLRRADRPGRAAARRPGPAVRRAAGGRRGRGGASGSAVALSPGRRDGAALEHARGHRRLRPGADRGRRQAAARLRRRRQARHRPGAAVGGPAHRLARLGPGRAQRPPRAAGAAGAGHRRPAAARLGGAGRAGDAARRVRPAAVPAPVASPPAMAPAMAPAPAPAPAGHAAAGGRRPGLGEPSCRRTPTCRRPTTSARSSRGYCRNRR